MRSSAHPLQRADDQHELALGPCRSVGVLLIAGSFNLGRLIGIQSGGVWNWKRLEEPIGAALFLVAGFAESHRLRSFEPAEGESDWAPASTPNTAR